ncbi:MAG: hypothetical protein ACLUAG_01445 [Lachnospiraceae bacterium]
MTLRILGGILLLIWTYYLFLLKHLLIIIAGTFESRKEGRSKEEKGVMTSEKWIGRSEESENCLRKEIKENYEKEKGHNS